MGSKGNGFLTSFEPELDEEQLRLREEAELRKQAILGKDSFPLSEFAELFKIETALNGNPDVLNNKTDIEIYEMAEKVGNPITDRVIKSNLEGGLVKPVFEIAGEKREVPVPLPAGFSEQAATMGRNIKDSFWGNITQTIEDGSLYPPSDPVKNAEYYLDARGPKSPKEEGKLKAKLNLAKLSQETSNRNYLKSQGLSPDEINFAIFQRNNREEKLNQDVIDRRFNNKRKTQEFIKNNPDIVARNEWHTGELWDSNKTKHLGNLANSVVISRGFIGGAGLLSGAVTMLLPVPGARVAGISQLAAGFAMEQANYLYGEADRLEQDKIIPTSEYLNDKANLEKYYKKTYPEPTYIEAFDKKLTGEQLYKMHMDNYYAQTQDGRVILKGHDPITALSIADIGDDIYGTVSGLTENLSNISAVKKALPLGIQNKVDNFWGLKTYKNITNKLSKEARKGLGKDKIKAYLKLHGIEVAGQMAAESIEEVAQGMQQSIIAVGSQSLLDEWKVPDLNVGIFQDFTGREGGHHGGLTQIRDEALGGALGGGGTSFIGAGKIVAGLNEKSENSSLAKLARTKVGLNFYVKKRSWKERKAGKSKYTIAARYTTKDMDTGKISSDEVSDVGDKLKLNDGSQASSDYDSFDHAFNTAELMNKDTSDIINKQLAWNQRSVNEGEVKVTKGKDDKYYIEIYNNAGKLHQRINKPYEFEAEATKDSQQFIDTMKKAKESYDRFGGPKLKDDPDIVEKQREREKQVKAARNLAGIEDDSTMDNFEQLRPQAALSYFMSHDFSDAAQGLQELRTDIHENDNVNKDPKVILDYMEFLGDDVYEGLMENHTPTAIEEEFIGQFKDRDDYDVHKKRLDTILNKASKNNNINEVPSGQNDISDTKESVSNEDLFIEEILPTAEEGPVNPAITVTTDEVNPGAPEDISFLEEPIPESIPDDISQPASKTSAKGPKGIKDLSDTELASEIASKKDILKNTSPSTPDGKIAKAMLSKLKKEQSSRKKAPVKKKIVKKLTDEEVSEKQRLEAERKLTPVIEMLTRKFKNKITADFVHEPDNDDAAWIDGNKIYINTASKYKDIATAPFHEFSHPFITEMRLTNEKLFSNILEDLIESRPKLFASLKADDKYGDLFENDLGAFYEEFIVHALEEASGYSYDSQSKFSKAIKKIMDWIADKLGFAKGDIEIRQLSPNMSLNDLANIIADNSNRYTISLNDSFFYELNDIADEAHNDTEGSETMISSNSFESEGKAIRTGETNIMIREISNILLLSNDNNRENSLRRFLPWMNKKYGNSYRKYSGKKLKKELSDIQKQNRISDNTNRRIQEENIVGFSDMEGYEFSSENNKVLEIKRQIMSLMPSNLQEMPKEIMESLDDNARLIARVGDMVEFSYKITDELLDKNPDKEFDVTKLASNKEVYIKGKPEKVKVNIDRNDPSKIRIENREARNEYKLINDFAIYYNKKFKTNMGLGKDISFEFKKWADKTVGFNFTRGHWINFGHDQIHYDRLIDDISKNDINSDIEVYRMGGHFGHSVRHAGGAYSLHNFDNFNNNGALLWYGIMKDRDGNILLHEYQSDVYKKFNKYQKELKELTGEIEIDEERISLNPKLRDKIKNLTEIMDDSAYSIINANIVATNAAFNGDAQIYELMRDVMVTVNFSKYLKIEDSVLKINDVLGTKISNSLLKILQKAIVDSEPGFELQALDNVIKESVDNLNVNLHDGERVADNMLAELRHITSAMENQVFDGFLQNNISTLVMKTLFDTKDSSKQKRIDLLEINQFIYDNYSMNDNLISRDFLRNHGPENMFYNDIEFFDKFPNKENSFYKQLQSKVNYDKRWEGKNNKSHNDSIGRGFEYAIKKIAKSGKGIYRHLSAIEFHHEAIPALINSSGNYKNLFWQDASADNKTPHAFLTQSKDAVYETQSKYRTSKNLWRIQKNLNNWKLDLFTGDSGYDLFKNYIETSFKNYYHQRLRLSITRTLLHKKYSDSLLKKDTKGTEKEEVKVIPKQTFNITDYKENLAEFKHASRIEEFQENQIPITIIHSLKHAFMNKSNDGKVYVQTGGANTILQGGGDATPVYNSKEEAKWENLISHIKAAKITFYDKFIFKSTPDGEQDIDMFRDLGINSEVFQDLLIGKHGKAILGLKTLDRDGEVKRYDTGEVYEDVKPLHMPIMQDMDSEWAWNTGLAIMDWLETKSPNKEFYKQMFKDSSPGAFSRYLKKVTSSGYKGPSGKGKGNDYGVSMKLVFPENSMTPLYEIVYNKPEKLIPRRYKKVSKEYQNSLSVPQSIDMLNIVSTRAIELNNLSERTNEKKVINRFFEDTYKNVIRIERMSGQKQVNILDFQRIMIDIIPQDLHLSFETWFNEKFDTIPAPKTNGIYIDKREISSEIARTYDSMEDKFDSIIERGGTDEKEFNLNELTHFPELDVSVTPENGAKIARLAFSNSFSEWKKKVLPNLLGVSLNQRKEVNRLLLQRYHRYKSTILTNRPLVDVNGTLVAPGGQRVNWNVIQNYSYNESTETYEFFDASVEPVGSENRDGSLNSKFDKVTIYEYNAPTGKKFIFSYIKGSNVISNQNLFDNNGNQVYHYNPQTGYQVKTKTLQQTYGFIKPNELLSVEYALRKQNKTIAFIRGDSATMLIVDISPEAKAQAKNAKAYWEGQRYVPDGAINELTSGDASDKASMIAIHMAMDSVWPKYLLDRKGGANVYKRLKLPFTPVTISDTMSPTRVIRFNPDLVKFQYKDNKSFSPIVYIFGEPTYILDGNSITSSEMFDDFDEHHGYYGPSFAKTVIYEKRGDNILAIKHGHVAAIPGFKILDKNDNLLFSVDSQGRINIENAHPSYVEGGNNRVKFLATNDEIKITEIFDNEGDDITVSGKSIGFTKYSVDSKSKTKHALQWYNYVKDNAVLEYFRDFMVPAIHKRITSGIYLTLNHHNKDGKLIKSSPDMILNFLEKSGAKNSEGYLPIFIEHAKLKAGVHKSNNTHMDKLVQTMIMNDALNLSESPGSILDIAIDPTGRVGRREVRLAKQNSVPIIKKVREITSKNLKISDINIWLKEEGNEIYVLISRVPITNKGGVYMAKVTHLHNRKSLADLNPIDVKEYLEGDGDGDEIHMELLDDIATPIFKNYLDNIDFIPQSLDKFKTGKKYNIFNKEQRFDTVGSLITGQTAIGEIATLIGVYGILNHKFKSISLQDADGFKVKVPIPKPSDKITFKRATYNGKLGGWTGTIEDYLRIWLQAAADNNEYGLLYEWSYGEKFTSINTIGGAKGIMYDVLGNPDPVWFETFWEDIYSHYKDVRTVRQGADVKKGRYSFKDTLERSVVAQQRESELLNNILFEMNDNSTTLHPLEYIAMAPSEVWTRIKTNRKLTGYDASPFILSRNVHNNAHRSAVKFVRSNLGKIIEKKFNQDKESNVITGDVKSWRDNQKIEANNYINQMMNEFYTILKTIGELNSQSWIRNQLLIDFTEKYDKQFKSLSNTAQGIATLKFLFGYSRFSGKLDSGSSAKQAVAIPPVSKTYKKDNLLDAGIMSVFFKAYNKVATDPAFKKENANRVTTGKATDIALDDYVNRICKGL